MAELYYKTLKNTETGDKIKRIINLCHQGRQEAEELCRELNAEEQYLINSRFILGTGLVAFRFSNEPDMKIWKKHKIDGYYEPRLKSKKGKEIQNKIFNLQRIDKAELSDAIGLSCWFRSPGFTEVKNYYLFNLESSWEHKMPNDCAEITGSEYDKLLKETHKTSQL